MESKFLTLSCAVLVSLGLASRSAHAAILVDFDQPHPPADGSYTLNPAIPSDFVTALGATGATATDILGSSVIGIDGLYRHANPPAGGFSGGGISVLPSGFSYDTGGAGSGPLYDEAFIGGGGSASFTITGLNLAPNQNYTLYVFADQVYTGDNETLNLTNYGPTQTVTGLNGSVATYSINSSDSTSNFGELDLNGTDSNYVGISGFALVASAPEPASLGLLAVSGLGLLARRRRA